MLNPLRAIAAASLILFASGGEAWAQLSADLCQASVPSFRDSRTAFIDADHERIATRLRQLSAENDPAKLAAARAHLQQRVQRERRSESGAFRAAIVESEMLQLIFLDQRERELVRNRARAVLQQQPLDRVSAEAFAMVALNVWGNYDDRSNRVDDYIFVERALSAHRQAFGDVERQFHLWDSLYEGAPHPAKRAEIARAFWLAVERSASKRLKLEAAVRLLAAAPATDAVRMRAASFAAPIAMMLAETPVRAAGNTETTCFLAYARWTPQLTASVPDGDVKVKFLRRALPHLARGVTWETHWSDVKAQVIPIMSSRAVDFEAYLSGLAHLDVRFANDRLPEKSKCNLEGRLAAICGALVLGGNFKVDGTTPLISLLVLRDARELAEKSDIPRGVLLTCPPLLGPGII